MNIDSDKFRLVKSLIELAPDDTQDVNVVTVESYHYRNRLKNNPFYYFFDQTIPRLARDKYLKIVGKPEEEIDWLVQSVNKPIYLKYTVQYSVKMLKEYKRNHRSNNNLLPEEPEEQIDLNKLPFCIEEKGTGYLKFSKRGEGIKIGRVGSRSHLFLKVMLESDLFGSFYDVNEVMEKIKLKKDEHNPELNRYYGNTASKVRIIKNSCIKQLQKGKKLKGRLTFEFDNNETHVRARLLRK